MTEEKKGIIDTLPQKSMDEIVRTLSLNQVRELAKKKLRGHILQLDDELFQISKLKERELRGISQDNGKDIAMEIWNENYQKNKRDMQEYGIWQEAYEDLYLTAKNEGKFDSNQLFKISGFPESW